MRVEGKWAELEGAVSEPQVRAHVSLIAQVLMMPLEDCLPWNHANQLHLGYLRCESLRGTSGRLILSAPDSTNAPSTSSYEFSSLFGSTQPHLRKIMDSKQKSIAVRVQPRIIIHGGAGNVTRASLPPDLVRSYRHALLNIVSEAPIQ